MLHTQSDIPISVGGDLKIPGESIAANLTPLTKHEVLVRSFSFLASFAFSQVLKS